MLRSCKVVGTLGGLLAAMFVLAACPAQQQPQVVEVTRVVQGEVQTVVVTATPEPAQAKSSRAPRPDTYTMVRFADIDTLDPNLAYDTASGDVIRNVMEGLIFYNQADPTTYVPVLAMEVPSEANGGISADGMTYTFNMRKGVKFQNGADLTPSDFAYTFHRGLLQSDPNGPQWLLLEPLLGYTSGDVTEEIAGGDHAGDREALGANATPQELAAVCAKVKATVTADDDAFTLTFHLAQPWGPFLATLAQTWGSALDQEWAVANGDWDGSCDTWTTFYAPGSENSKLTSIINGTGPYMLERWTPGEGYVLKANENYWRQAGDAMWSGGPSGVARIKTVNVNIVTEWGTRFAILQAGDAERVEVLPANRPQVDQFVGENCNFRTMECTPTGTPDAPLRRWGGLPQTSRTNIFLNFDVVADESGSNPYIGSGKLDGNGIPADFFTDIHVRKAFNYCFDYDTFIQDAQNGEGVRNNGPIILDMLGYNPNGPEYEFSLDKCKDEMAQAWGGQVAEKGFRIQVAFNTGNVTRQTAAAILQNSFLAVDPKYQIDIVGLPWPTLLRSSRAKQLPVSISGWIEDIHDPHNWVQPFTVGTYASQQNLPADLKGQFQELVNAGVAATDPAKRTEIYAQLQQLYYDTAIQVVLSQETGVSYEQRWVKDWYYNPVIGGWQNYYYAYGLVGGE